MPRNRKNHFGSAAALMLAVVPGMFVTLALFPSPALAQAEGRPVATDKLILRSGRIIDGKVMEETDTQVKFMIITAGISAAQWFDRSDILAVEKGEAPAGGDPTPDSKPDPKAKRDAAQANVEPGARAGAKKIYVINLEGEFGVDFSQTPIRDAIKDAKKHQPDYLIFVLNNEWTSEFQDLPDDAWAAGELFRAEEMAPIFAKEIPEQWGEGKIPEIIFWVKQAMGGTAILSFACPNIYFAPDARLGGLGNLSLQLGSTGDEVVRQKLYSAYMAHVESWAVKGGYDYRLIRAICRFEYVLSYKMVGGRPEYIERMPENPDEFNLTDDGDDQAGRRDTVEERVRGQGNDVLTLNADLARKLGFSRGTVNSIGDLMYALGISRNHVVVKGRADTLMEGWGRGVADAKRDLRRLAREFDEIQVQGDYPERSRARGARMAKANEMKRIISRFGESLTTQWFAETGFPPAPADQQIITLDGLIDQIRLEQLADKR